MGLSMPDVTDKEEEIVQVGDDTIQEEEFCFCCSAVSTWEAKSCSDQDRFHVDNLVVVVVAVVDKDEMVEAGDGADNAGAVDDING